MRNVTFSHLVDAADEALLLHLVLPGLEKLLAEVREAGTRVVQLRRTCRQSYDLTR